MLVTWLVGGQSIGSEPPAAQRGLYHHQNVAEVPWLRGSARGDAIPCTHTFIDCTIARDAVLGIFSAATGDRLRRLMDDSLARVLDHGNVAWDSCRWRTIVRCIEIVNEAPHV